MSCERCIILEEKIATLEAERDSRVTVEAHRMVCQERDDEHNALLQLHAVHTEYAAVKSAQIYLLRTFVTKIASQPHDALQWEEVDGEIKCAECEASKVLQALARQKS